MKAIKLPAVHDCRLPFYLAVEEWVARNLPADDSYFFAWQVEPSVIAGRHQDIAAEVKLPYAESRGIKVWRRKSGGGCVYADRNNVMFSHITGEAGVQGSFSTYTSMVCRMLAGLGIDACATGRNDIAVHGRKVAGNAYYKTSGRSIVHGTMLYDADFATMSQLLTPSRAKLISHGVPSVEARMTTLRAEGLGLSCRQFIDRAVDELCHGEYVELADDDIAAIVQIEETYLEPGFVHGRRSAGTVSRSKRFAGGGEVCASYDLDAHGAITGLRLTGDFFAEADIDETIIRPLLGVTPDGAAIRRVLEAHGANTAIEGVSIDNLAEIITYQPIIST